MSKTFFVPRDKTYFYVLNTFKLESLLLGNNEDSSGDTCVPMIWKIIGRPRQMYVSISGGEEGCLMSQENCPFLVIFLTFKTIPKQEVN